MELFLHFFHTLSSLYPSSVPVRMFGVTIRPLECFSRALDPSQKKMMKKNWKVICAKKWRVKGIIWANKALLMLEIGLANLVVCY